MATATPGASRPLSPRRKSHRARGRPGLTSTGQRIADAREPRPMLSNWVVIVAAFGYISLLFAIASYGDRVSSKPRRHAGVLIYPLSLAIYCTSWTFFGSVGLASRTGVEFLAIYAGPVLMVGLCTPLLMRVVRLAKAHNITSIADFIAARYGKSQAGAATVAISALRGR